MKVLLVDDEEDIRKVGRVSLEGVGKFEARLAEDAANAFEILGEFRPDVILMDMMMPGMDGLEALSNLKAHDEWSTIPVIFMSAKVQLHEVNQYIEAGAIGVIQKPFDPMTLPSEIAAILNRGD